MPDLSLYWRGSNRLWIAAAAVAAVLHAGFIALALAYAQPEEDDDDLGAPAIEIGVELTAPRAEPTDLPPGPDTEASAASPPVVEQKEVIKASELPKAIPTETDDPDRLVAPDNAKKVPDDEPETASAKAVPTPESIAVEATATPTSEAIQEAPRSVAPAQGTAESRQRVRVTWQKELAAHLDRNKRYPVDRTLQHAEVVISFVLDRIGHVVSAAIVKSSSDRSFDDAALAMMRRADPVPAPPPSVADDGLTFTLPVIFRVKGQH